MDRWPHNCEPPRFQHSANVNAPYVVRDGMPGGVNGTFHHAALRKFDSKSAYRRATKEHGCIEVGGERAAFERQAAQERNRDMAGKDVIESAVNEALHQHGISSESDMGKVSFNGAE